MEHATLDTFRESLKRCLATPEFLHDFYERFIASGDDIKEKFKKTEFPRQTRVLADSLYVLAMAAESRDDAFAWRELDRLAGAHSRQGLDVDPKHYDTWLDCLVAAARTFDPQFTPDTETAWRAALSPGIAHLRNRY
jgi:hemoglobin-like flavoprotein